MPKFIPGSLLDTVSKTDAIELLCYRRDSMLLTWCKTQLPGWRDPMVKDVDRYRVYLLGVVMRDEEMRAKLTGQEPTTLVKLTDQWMRAVTGPRKADYLYD